jgi:hypothetical protein
LTAKNSSYFLAARGTAAGNKLFSHGQPRSPKKGLFLAFFAATNRQKSLMASNFRWHKAYFRWLVAAKKWLLLLLLGTCSQMLRVKNKATQKELNG